MNSRTTAKVVYNEVTLYIGFTKGSHMKLLEALNCIKLTVCLFSEVIGHWLFMHVLNEKPTRVSISQFCFDSRCKSLNRPIKAQTNA